MVASLTAISSLFEPWFPWLQLSATYLNHGYLSYRCEPLMLPHPLIRHLIECIERAEP